MYTVRADEAEHRDVANHLVCGMKEGQGQSFVRSRIQVGCNALEVCPQHYVEEPRQGLASIPEGWSMVRIKILGIVIVIAGKYW
jgi:hypothetical protein